MFLLAVHKKKKKKSFQRVFQVLRNLLWKWANFTINWNTNGEHFSIRHNTLCVHTVCVSTIHKSLSLQLESCLQGIHSGMKQFLRFVQETIALFCRSSTAN